MPDLKRRFLIGVMLAAVRTSPAQLVQDELAVKDYCDLSQNILTVAEAEWRARIALVQAQRTFSRSRLGTQRSMRAQYDRVRSNVYAAYGTTQQRFLRYGATHQSAINDYLEAHPEVKAALDDANSRIQSLRQEVESLEATAAQGGVKQ